jgi:hypothetical protein
MSSAKYEASILMILSLIVILYNYPIECMCLIEYQTYLHIKIKSRNKRKAGCSIYCVIIQRMVSVIFSDNINTKLRAVSWNEISD